MKRYKWLEAYLLAKPGVEKEYRIEWEMDRYLLAGKSFCQVGGDRDGRPIITLKLEPAKGDMLRREFADIVPGYYMNKVHWNSIYMEGKISDSLLRELLDDSYSIALHSLSRKAQRALLEGTEASV